MIVSVRNWCDYSSAIRPLAGRGRRGIGHRRKFSFLHFFEAVDLSKRGREIIHCCAVSAVPLIKGFFGLISSSRNSSLILSVVGAVPGMS